jgi:hypothetical protein
VLLKLLLISYIMPFFSFIPYFTLKESIKADLLLRMYRPRPFRGTLLHSLPS